MELNGRCQLLIRNNCAVSRDGDTEEKRILQQENIVRLTIGNWAQRSNIQKMADKVHKSYWAYTVKKNRDKANEQNCVCTFVGIMSFHC